MTLTQHQLFEGVREVLVESLGVEPSEVTPDALLTPHLNAESIDYLDIAFRLEKAFGISVKQNEMFPENVLSNPLYVADGQLTDAGVAALATQLPFADLSQLSDERNVGEIINVITVRTLVEFVRQKLDQ